MLHVLQHGVLVGSRRIMQPTMHKEPGSQVPPSAKANSGSGPNASVQLPASSKAAGHRATAPEAARFTLTPLGKAWLNKTEVARHDMWTK